MTNAEYMALTPQQKYHLERETRRERDRHATSAQMKEAKRLFDVPRAIRKGGRPKKRVCVCTSFMAPGSECPIHGEAP
jgi:hypothetical protein